MMASAHTAAQIDRATRSRNLPGAASGGDGIPHLIGTPECDGDAGGQQVDHLGQPPPAFGTAIGL